MPGMQKTERSPPPRSAFTTAPWIYPYCYCFTPPTRHCPDEPPSQAP
jgi:hypothetical protein